LTTPASPLPPSAPNAVTLRSAGGRQGVPARRQSVHSAHVCFTCRRYRAPCGRRTACTRCWGAPCPQRRRRRRCPQSTPHPAPKHPRAPRSGRQTGTSPLPSPSACWRRRGCRLCAVWVVEHRGGHAVRA